MFSRDLAKGFGSYLFLLLLTGAALAAPKPPPAPVVTWGPSSLTLTVAQGATKSATVTMTVSKDLRKIQLIVGPSGVAPLVSVSPRNFAKLPVGATDITVTVTVPHTTALGTYQGSLDVWQGSKKVSEGLPIELKVVKANSPPIANDDSALTQAGHAVDIDVLANDTDADEDALIITNLGQPANGQVTEVNGFVTYTPSSGFFGTDSFEYRITDGRGGTDMGTVGVVVFLSPLNDTGIDWWADGTTNFLTTEPLEYPGQDASFGRDATDDDDSDGHAGFSFTKLDANGNPLDAAASEWSCVRDNVTGLVWEVKTDDGGLRDADWTYSSYDSVYNDGPDSPSNPPTILGLDGIWAGPLDTGGDSVWDSCGNPAKICTTEQYVLDVNTVGLCGAHDWRLPTVKELENILSRDRHSPAIDTAWFPNTRVKWYWSSSSFAGDATIAWGISYSNYTSFNMRHNDGAVRLVRGSAPSIGAPIAAVGDQICNPNIPPSTPTNKFEVHGDGTVTDTRSGLMWKQCLEGLAGADCGEGYALTLTWQEALLQPETVNSGVGYAGHTDWRLPNINELRSIVEEQCHAPAINLNLFPNNGGVDVWSSSSNSAIVYWIEHAAWGVFFHHGYVTWGDRNGAAAVAVRLVRDVAP